MSVHISISSKYGKVALTDEILSDLVDAVSGLQRDGDVLIWEKDEDQKLHINIEPNELWCDGIDSGEDYELIDRIAEQLDFQVFADGEPIAKDEPSVKGLSLLGIMGSIVVGIASILIFLISLLILPFRLMLAFRKK